MRKHDAAEETATAIRVGLARKRTSQSALADHLQVSQPAIHRRMSGKVSWRIDELAQVAEFLNVPIEALLAKSAEVVAS